MLVYMRIKSAHSSFMGKAKPWRKESSTTRTVEIISVVMRFAAGKKRKSVAEERTYHLRPRLRERRNIRASA